MKRGVKHKVHQVQRKQTDSHNFTRYVQNVHHWHEHKHASMLAIGQLRHQSATTPSLATHAADAVAAHQRHECDSDVIFTSHVKQVHNLQTAFIPVSRYVKLLK